MRKQFEMHVQNVHYRVKVKFVCVCEMKRCPAVTPKQYSPK